MLITDKLVLPNGDICYEIDDDGFKQLVLLRALYDKYTLDGLIKEGYSFVDYHGNIITPTGERLQDREAKPVTLSDFEYQNLLDFADDIALSEAEAVVYFTRDTTLKTITLKEATVPQIKTREQFVAYLQQLNRMSGYVNLAIEDHRPINAIVAREALFSIEEVIQNQDTKKLLEVLSERKKIRSKQGYDNLIKFLVNEGVLRSSTPTRLEFLDAYTAWGVDGIKTPVVERKQLESSAGTIFEATSQTMGKAVNRTAELCLLDKSGTIFSSMGKIDFTGVDNFKRELFYPYTENTYWDLYKSRDQWFSDFKPINCTVPLITPRIAMTLIDDDGVLYEARIEVDNTCIITNRQCITSAPGFRVKLIDDCLYPLSLFKSANEFKVYNMILTAITAAVKARTVECPVSSSYEMCLKEGVSPEAALHYLCREVMTNGMNVDLRGDMDYMDAWELYSTQGAPEIRGSSTTFNLQQKYNPDSLPYNNVDDLLDIFNAAQEEKTVSGGLSLENLLQPIERMNFAKRLRTGELSISELGLGLYLDSELDKQQLIRYLKLVMDTVGGYDESSINATYNALSTILKDRTIFDMNDIIHERNNAHIGYLKDRAYLNRDRARQSTSAVFVENVFREMANLPTEEQRHFACECLVLDVTNGTVNRNYINVLEQCLQNAINKTAHLTAGEKELLTIESPMTALRLCFKLGVGNIETSSSALADHRSVKETIVGGIDITVDIPMYIVQWFSNLSSYKRQYVILADWCQYEMGTNHAFNYVCLNADINPWFVIPKKGFTIRSHNFAINHLKAASLKAMSEGYQEKVRNTRVARLSEFGISGNIIQYVGTEDSTLLTRFTVDEPLDWEGSETFDYHYQRFTITNTKLAETGSYLNALRLRSDAIFDSYAEACGVTVRQEALYSASVNKEDKQRCLTQMDIVPLRNVDDIKAISANTRLSQFNISEFTLNDIVAWPEIVDNRFNPTATVMFNGVGLIVLEGVSKRVIPLSELDQEVESLYTSGAIYRLNAYQYMIKTPTETLLLEV